MATTTVLLREDIENLGGRGEVVKVKAGYARNYLLPQKFATLATKANVSQISKERESLLKKAATEKSTAEAQSEQMKDISLTFERKAGESGTLFGSVTTIDIAEALQAKGYEIDRRKIVLKDTIKEIGEYTAKIKLYREVVLDIPVKVTAEGAVEAPAKAETEEKVVENSVETTQEETES